MSTLTDKVNFNRIRYANCWEDADLLVSSLQLPAEKNILCVASAGDNALALLATNPAGLVATDLSAPQLYLTELKQMAFHNLEYDELLQLLGVRAATAQTRKSLFGKAATTLSAAAKSYWRQHQPVIEQGVIYHGKFEHYFKLFRTWLLPLVHSHKRIDQLLSPKSGEAQRAFYQDHWNTWRWRCLMNFFFSKRIMGKYGRDPEFLKHVSINVPQYIRHKAETHLQSSLATQNYFLYFIFKGAFGNGLPFYLREENYEHIRRNVERMSLTQQDAGTIIRERPFDTCCLSNIFEYFSPSSFRETASVWIQWLKPGARLAFWNLMAPRSFTEEQPQHYRTLTTDTARDKGFFYSRFLLEERI